MDDRAIFIMPIPIPDGTLTYSKETRGRTKGIRDKVPRKRRSCKRCVANNSKYRHVCLGRLRGVTSCEYFDGRDTNAKKRSYINNSNNNNTNNNTENGTTRYETCRFFSMLSNDSSLFDFVDLGKGTSKKLKQLAESDNSNLSNMVVFNCNEEAYEKLSPSNKNNLSTLSTGVYTDTYRRQTIMMDTFNSHKEVTRVQDILQKKLKKDNILRRGSLLHTLPGGLRQQFHKDFDSCSKDKMFVIIPLQMNQYIYIKILGNKNVKLMLKNDHALVGNASLVHAGSEQRGKRLHFEFVPRDGVEVIEKNATYFEVDEEYPSRGECLKMSL